MMSSLVRLSNRHDWEVISVVSGGSRGVGLGTDRKGQSRPTSVGRCYYTNVVSSRNSPCDPSYCGTDFKSC